MPSSGSFSRQLSGREDWISTSKRWGCNNQSKHSTAETGFNWGCETSFQQMEELNNGGLSMRKRVMVVVDYTSHSRHAMIWALTHAANKGDLLTLLHIIPSGADSSSPHLANSLGSLCKACKPQVEVEALVIHGPRLATVMNQVKKLDVSVLVVGHKRPSPLTSCLCGSSSSEDFVEQCINNAECLTIGVSKQSKNVGGYLISTRWKKNFWLLA